MIIESGDFPVHWQTIEPHRNINGIVFKPYVTYVPMW